MPTLYDNPDELLKRLEWFIRINEGTNVIKRLSGLDHMNQNQEQVCYYILLRQMQRRGKIYLSRGPRLSIKDL
jgi:hypothetical protein